MSALGEESEVFVTQVLLVAFLAGVADGPRKEFVACLHKAVESAKSGNVSPDNFSAYAHNACAAIEATFKAGLVSFNLKNGMSKKSASEDAQIQIDDYVLTAEDRYKFALETSKPQ